MKKLRLLFRGRNSIDAGCTYGAFSRDLDARIYLAKVAEHYGIDPSELKIIDLDMDPEFVWPPTVVDNLGPQ